MIYDLHQKTIISDGDLPPRNYYVPFSKPDTFDEKVKSDLLKSVYDWKISKVKKFSQSIFSQKARIKKSLPAACKQLCKITSSNIFPFEYTPPEINGDIAAVVYESKVKFSVLKDKYYLVFESVSACFYLFLNGKYVGYSARGQSMTEFDITPYMKIENDIKVVVLDRCALSYISAIKPIRPFGITGDVYILNRPMGHLTNYSIVPKFDGGRWKIYFSGDEETEVRLFDDKREIGKKTGKNLSFEIDKPKEWSSEQPHLYKVLLHCKNEYIEEKVGLIETKTEGQNLIINGKKIFLKGVVRTPFTAYGCFENDKTLCEDVIRIKKCGINAVYSPYYPANPELSKLCDKYGLYLIESVEVNYANGDCLTRLPYGGIKSLIDCKDFENAALSRVEYAKQRDKNRASVIMWATGGMMQSENAKAINLNDETAFTLDENLTANNEKSNYFTSYESNFNGDIKNENNSENYDIATDINENFDILSDENEINKAEKNQLFMSFNYGFGVNSGEENCAVIATQDEFYLAKNKPTILFTDVFSMNEMNCLNENENNLAGVFPCEFIYLKNKTNAFYGLYDRETKRYSPMLKNMLNVYFPIDVLRKDDRFIVKNNNKFVDGKNFRGKCYIKVDGKQVDGINIDVSSLSSGESKEIKIDLEKYKGNFVCADFVLKELTYGASVVKQFIISDSIAMYKPLSFTSVQLYGNVMNCNRCSVKFSDNGLISSVSSGKKKYIIGKISFCVDRPPLNKIEKYISDNEKLSKVKFVAKKIKSEGNVLYVSGVLFRQSMAELLKVDLEYSFFDNGTIIIKVKPTLPDYIDGLYRFGLSIPLYGKFKKVAYLGRGKDECYFGEESFNSLGEYECDVKNLNEKMPIFNESGSRADVRRITFFKKRDKINFYVDSPVSFKARLGEMKNKKSFFARKKKVCYLNLDFCMSGRMGKYVEEGKMKDKTSCYTLTIEV